MATSFLALTVRFQLLLVSAPRVVWLQRTVPTLARPLPGAALSPRSSYFTSLLLARRQQTGDTAASRGDEDKLKYNFPAASGQWPRRTPGWRRGHRQGPDHRSLRVNTQRGLQSSPPPPPRRGHCVPSLSPAACCGQDRVLVVRPGATSVWLDS